MNRKVGALAGLVAVALAVWLFAFRDRGGAAKPTPANQPGATKVDPWGNAAKKGDDTPEPPKGTAPRWTLDVDPQGPLVLEGQVVDEDKHGIGGAEVWLSSVPPRSVKTEGDG